jgi:hypothetical protein
MDIPFTNHIKIMAVLLVSLSLGACVGETTSSTDTPSSIVISEAAPAATDTTTSTGSTTGTDTTTSTGSTTGTDTTTSTGSTTGTDTTTSTGSTTGTDTTTSTGSTTGTDTTTSTGSTTGTDTTTSTGTSTSTGTATLNWLPPTENTDGSVLTDLSGYKIYYGTSPDTLTNIVSNIGIGVTTYVIDNLQTNTTYYFSMTSVNQNEVESTLSNVVSKYISG